ncbi:hypothetical protein GF402_01225, partial [Candidatus Fermentibacteria bacterium]|nr:hypothetical protein [Candidatus Fermentibacteria bacterium]
IGWLEKGQEEGLRVSIDSCRTRMMDAGGRPECMGMSAPGRMRYVDSDLPLSAIIAITTGRVGRKRGLAGRMTAELLALDAEEGAAVSGLGMFEQGYYDRLGFGTGSYVPWVSLDPSDLEVDVLPRPPVRLGMDDFEDIHAGRLSRMPAHGACSLDPPGLTKAEMIWSGRGFGLGYRDDSGGEITHHLWINAGKDEHGPDTVWWMAYRNLDQLTELLGLLRQLGDQVHLVRLKEPVGIQIQDLMNRPLKQFTVRKKSKYEARVSAFAYWQLRICDLRKCIEAVRLPCGELSFNLELSDPVAGYLEEDAPWKGVGGRYVVTLGKDSGITEVPDENLPTLKASVGAFSRMWLGVRPASGLAVTDDLSGPLELLAELDRAFLLPPPRFDWDY